ncbi:hypothetical protein H2200_001961 [Cladophialophora chaetospira]|uniref:AB hydrolase-1 domain-containing protein n=1 Tax=Cladophialophora chaetospira TaxID=386627 RepID=A0AA38XLV2_9EURO|nr:hypothetical protein H2200_001961 [Cladophialophora chaetospira]
MMRLLPLILLAQLSTAQTSQIPAAEPQNTTFNATYGQINPSQAEARIARANLSEELSAAVLVAANFERSNWAGSSTQLDPFYDDIPSNASTAPAGSVIKIEQYTNTSFYTLAPNVALSRFLFMTENFNGTAIPASAFVLWPWMPRQFSNISGLPVVVVVAPDYAGLGVDHDGNGTYIPHQYLAYPAHGNDLIYSVQAAQKAWPALSKEFIVMGHSQGGGAAWSAAQILARNPVEGYLGTVAGSPGTSLQASLTFNQGKPASIGSYLLRAGLNIKSIFPSFNLGTWINEKGLRIASLLQDLQGCQSVALELLGQTDLYKQNWNSTWYFSRFNNLTSNGGKPFAGPMLVLQGTNDSSVFEPGTTAAVNATCASFPNHSLQYAMFQGVSHVPVLNAGQQIWLEWIADRFNGIPASKGCSSTLYKPELSVASYQKELKLFLQYPEYGYETA